MHDLVPATGDTAVAATRAQIRDLAGHATHSQPRGLAVNPPTHTAHVNNNFQVGSLSVFNTARH